AREYRRASFRSGVVSSRPARPARARKHFSPRAPIETLNYAAMTSRHSSRWSAGLGLLVSSLATASACSSDDSEGNTSGAGGTPTIADSDGNGAIFDGDDGAAPSASDGFDSNEACVGREAGTELAPSIVQLLV